MSHKRTLHLGFVRHRNTKAVPLTPGRNNQAIVRTVENLPRSDFADYDKVYRLRRDTASRYRSCALVRHHDKPRRLHYAHRIVFRSQRRLTRPERWWNDNLRTADSN